jgi:hypothetical protein
MKNLFALFRSGVKEGMLPYVVIRKDILEKLAPKAEKTLSESGSYCIFCGKSILHDVDCPWIAARAILEDAK